MEERNIQIKKKQSEKEDLENQNFIYMKKIDELNANLKTLKKKQNGEQKDLADQLKNRDSEMEVLKEMIRSTKL